MEQLDFTKLSVKKVKRENNKIFITFQYNEELNTVEMKDKGTDRADMSTISYCFINNWLSGKFNIDYDKLMNFTDTF
jgi:hypothetical protein